MDNKNNLLGYWKNQVLNSIDNEDDKLKFIEAEKCYTNKNYFEAFNLFSSIINTIEKLHNEYHYMYLISFVLKDTPYLEFDNLTEPYFTYINSIKQKCDVKINNNEQISEDELSIINLTLYDEESIFDFGKYKGKKTIEIINSDPEYILSEIIKSFQFIIDPVLFLKINLLNEKEAHRAIIINSAKCDLLGKWDSDEQQKEYDKESAQIDEEKRKLEKENRELIEEMLLELENDNEEENITTYNRYNGSFAQDEMGYSDQDIDDAFDGDPEAYWNID